MPAKKAKAVAKSTKVVAKKTSVAPKKTVRKTRSSNEGLISTSISRGWEIVKKEPMLMISGTVLMLLAGSFESIVDGVFGEQAGLTAFVIWLAGMALSSTVTLGFTAMVFRLLDNKKAELQDLLSQTGKVVTYLLATFLVTIVTLLGLILLILPGLYIALRLGFYSYFILEKDAGIVESLKKSWEATEGHVFELAMLSLVLLGLNILGLIALFVGLLVTIPISMVASAQAYRMIATKK